MTLPGEPKIKINPSKDERATLPEWFEVKEYDGDMVRIFHIERRNEWNAMGPVTTGSLKLHRRDACTLSDHIGAYLWKPGDEKDTANQADDVDAEPYTVKPPHQCDLYGGLPPHQLESSTSRDAAISILPDCNRLQALVLEEIRRSGKHGCTDREIESRLGLLGSTVRPRRVELFSMGLIIDSGRRRPTASGRMATVWIAKPADGDIIL